MWDEWVIAGDRIAFPGGVSPGWIHVSEGVIVGVGSVGDPMPDTRLHFVASDAVLPGLVDSHVHVNEPGRTEWEGFETATRAAAAGGTTTIVDMPLNSVPPTTSAAALREKRKAARHPYVDVAFWGGVVPGNVDDLAPLADEGVCGFKGFLVDSGVEEFPPVDNAELESALGVLADIGGRLIVHAEDPGVLREPGEAFAALRPEQRRAYGAYLASRPAEAEDRAVAHLAEAALAHGVPIHILHLASASALEAVRVGRARGAALSIETCPHYLHFSAEEIPDGATEYKCAPPIRDEANRRGLWQGLFGGQIDAIVSDHSPAPAEMKEIESGDFGEAWGGISSLQLRLPVVWSAGQEFGIRLEDVARWLAKGPADIAGLSPRKGSIEVGADADLVVFDPAATFEVVAHELEHRHPVSPYEGHTLQGVVRTTFLRGVPVFADGSVVADQLGERLRSRE